MVNAAPNPVKMHEHRMNQGRSGSDWLKKSPRCSAKKISILAIETLAET
jgi:hypothetical protein